MGPISAPGIAIQGSCKRLDAGGCVCDGDCGTCGLYLVFSGIHCSCWRRCGGLENNVFLTYNHCYEMFAVHT